MKEKMILPALTEAESPFWRLIKYSLFPSLGLATLAACLSPDEIDLQDQQVEKVQKPGVSIQELWPSRVKSHPSNRTTGPLIP